MTWTEGTTPGGGIRCLRSHFLNEVGARILADRHSPDLADRCGIAVGYWVALDWIDVHLDALAGLVSVL
jgi:hypothetical protein